MRLLPILLSCLIATAHATPPVPDDAALRSYAQKALEQAIPAADGPGIAVLVARGDKVVYRGARGMASLELGMPLSPEHVFRIGSITKQFSAAAVLKLAEQGRLSLDDPLAKFVPGYPNGDNITVRMLLNHTSGVRSYTDIPGVMESSIRKDFTTVQLIDSFKDEKPDFAPGEGWHYNNSGYVLVGAVIEAASGEPWHEYQEKTLFQPLQLAHTGYGDTAIAVIPGHASGYSLNGERWAAAKYLSMTQPHAAGALVSNVDDLLRWNRALHEGKVLKPESYRQMTTAVENGEEGPYGLGIVVDRLRGERVLRHGGGIFGFSTYLLYLPDHEITVAALYNADGGKPGMMGPGALAHAVAAYAVGKPYPEKKAIPLDEATLKEYEGVYRIDENSARALRVIDGKLVSQRTGGPAFELIPIAKDDFLFKQGFSRMAFERDGNGRLTAMRFFLEDEGAGEVVPRSNEPLPTERQTAALDRAALERLVGEYEYQGVVMAVLLDGDAPKVRLTGQPAFEIFPESPSKFFLKVVEATLEFAPEEGVPETVTLRQGGAVLEYRRRR